MLFHRQAVNNHAPFSDSQYSLPQRITGSVNIVRGIAAPDGDVLHQTQVQTLHEDELARPEGLAGERLVIGFLE